MLSDPETRRLIVQSALGSVAVRGGSPSTPAGDVTAGTFGGSGGGGQYIFLANGATTTPLTVKGAASQSVPLQDWKNSAGDVLATVQGDGKVGVGTDAPQTKAHVTVPDSNTVVWALTLQNPGCHGDDAQGVGIKLKLSDYSSSDETSKWAGVAAVGNVGQGWSINVGVAFYVRNEGADPYEAGRFDSLGRLGLGTTTPTQKLDVNGAIAIAGTAIVSIGRVLSNVTADAAIIASGTLDDGRLPPSMSGKTFSGNVLPSSTGLDLGSGAQRWDVFGANGDFTGNIGIGASPPAEKLDVAGKIRASGDHPILIDPTSGEIETGKLNRIVFLRPVGNGQDDRPQIQAAIDALPDQGGIIYLVPHATGPANNPFRISKTQDEDYGIRVKRNGVKLRGYGGIWPDETGYEAVTTLLWSEEGGGTIVELASEAADAAIWDLELSDLTLDGHGYATKGVVLDKVSSSKFRSVHVRNINGTGFELTASDANAGVNSAWNLFENCSAVHVAKGVVLTGNLDPDAAANSCHNTFIGLAVHYNGTAPGDAGIYLQFCDNNSFYRCWIFQASNQGPPMGPGVVVDDPDCASGNYFYHLQAGAGGFRIDNADDAPSSKNVVFGYDQGNKQPAPVSTPDSHVQKFLSWIDSNGAIFGSQELAITGRQFTAAGTVSANAQSSNVTGGGTFFFSEVKVGDKITIEGETRGVTAITADDSLTADSAFNSTHTNKQMTVSPPLLRIADSSDSTKVLVSDSGNLSLAGNLSAEGTVSASGTADFASLRIGGTEAISDQRVLHNVTADAGIITSGVFSADRIPSLDAAKIGSGTLNSDRIPSLDAGKIGSGIINDARLPDGLLRFAASGRRKIAWAAAHLSGGAWSGDTGLSSIEAAVVTSLNGTSEVFNAYELDHEQYPGRLAIGSNNSQSTEWVWYIAIGT
jgi:hypothetical protein